MFKKDLFLQSRFLNSAGSLGFAPDLRSEQGLFKLAAFITNPISLMRRRPVNTRNCLPFDGGFLLHSGFPNPGIRAVLKTCAPRWAAAPIPVIPHLIAFAPDEIERMVRLIEGLENVTGVEIGLPEGIDPHLAAELVSRAFGELSVIACLPFEDALSLARFLRDDPITAFSLSAPRGTLPGPDGSLVNGRLYGPAVLPTALRVVSQLAREGITVFGSGGVYSRQDADAMLSAGASAVQLDTVFWGVEGVNILAGW